MDQVEILKNLRRLIGNPGVNEVSERELQEFVASASDWLASELKDQFKTDTFLIALEPGVQEYSLPADVGWILLLEWNDLRLGPSSHFQFDRGGMGYRQATAANPSEFAVYGRKLILQAPPSASAVTTDATLTMRAITTALPMTAGGLPGFSDFDARLMLYEAAYEWLALHPSDENNARAQACLQQVQRLLPGAKERSMRPIEDQGPRWWPQITRGGAAR